jgi:hypothetical protein
MTVGNAIRIERFGLSPKSHQLIKVTMITWELPISVEMPAPIQSVELWYDTKSRANTKPATIAISLVLKDLLSSTARNQIIKARNGRAYSILKKAPLSGFRPETLYNIGAKDIASAPTRAIVIVLFSSRMGII